MKILIPIILFLTLSCSNYYSVYSECSNTEQALKAWQDIQDFDYYYTSRERTANIIIKKQNSDRTPLGVYYGHGYIKANDTYRTVSHEIGHFLGYKHNDNINSIMYPYALESATQFIDLRSK